MNKKNFIFTFIFVTVCISTNAQWKQSDAYASGMHNTVVRRKAIDTASLRIKYAWGLPTSLRTSLIWTADSCLSGSA